MNLIKFLYLTFLLFNLSSCNNKKEEKSFSKVTKTIKLDTIIDSDLKKIKVRSDLKNFNTIYKELSLINVYYFGYDSLIHRGQLVCHKSVANELKEIFIELYKIKFPIESVRPISLFEWNDEISMSSNNTSCFNYRTVSNSNKLSEHSKGLAIDLNPKYNPYISSKGVISPKNGEYNNKNIGTIIVDSKVISIFKDKGWKWGGNWKRSKDYQHFSKNGR
ncbi:MAG: M15 family metallopeptidase [Flavobacteriaceae bacterium]|nr:M15 family metallopeptidase [Flavobacteriaceae bacterium]